jgi:two-component system LytT family response regulator
MIPVLIIDDEPHGRDILVEYLDGHPSLKIVGQCADGFEAFKAIRELQPELIFMDVQMPRINGFELLELLDTPPSVIFTTAYDTHALRAFEANAIDYLLKPFSKERFEQAVEKWLAQRSNRKGPIALKSISNNRIPERVVLKSGHKIHIIQVADIYCLEAADDYVKIHSPDGVFLKKETMARFTEQLEGSRFVRVHRSWLLSIAALQRINVRDREGFDATLINGLTIPVSRQGYAKLKEVLNL